MALADNENQNLVMNIMNVNSGDTNDNAIQGSNPHINNSNVNSTSDDDGLSLSNVSIDADRMQLRLDINHMQSMLQTLMQTMSKEQKL
jgi:hypothetical protein